MNTLNILHLDEELTRSLMIGRKVALKEGKKQKTPAEMLRPKLKIQHWIMEYKNKSV